MDHSPITFSSFFVFNSSLSKTDNDEENKIICYLPESELLNTKMSHIGLSEGLILFTSAFSVKRPCEVLTLKKKKQVFYECEKGFWMSIRCYRLFVLFHGTFERIIELKGIENLRIVLREFARNYIDFIKFSEDSLNKEFLKEIPGMYNKAIEPDLMIDLSCFLASLEEKHDEIYGSMMIHNYSVAVSTMKREQTLLLSDFFQYIYYPARDDEELFLKSSTFEIDNDYLPNTIQFEEHLLTSEIKIIFGLKIFPKNKSPIQFNCPSIHFNTDNGEKKEQKELVMVVFEIGQLSFILIINKQLAFQKNWYKSFIEENSKKIETLSTRLNENENKKFNYPLLIYDISSKSIKINSLSIMDETELIKNQKNDLINNLNILFNDVEVSKSSFKEIILTDKNLNLIYLQKQISQILVFVSLNKSMNFSEILSQIEIKIKNFKKNKFLFSQIY
ncbi:vacuolar fusion protein ccz1 homolog-related [Anaeramoeba flamelloides]|uniref:Vacuolar fusion protein ccz1 homolog-related n=1 Tax=Anaeramoeba flamelloides TaxID=1746091 RepID=A0ABQ8Y1I4_9EUKA|nr:vacuolar fusion protein ccz1 homolog-related [Anaeramoeba flamelloides]